MKVLRSLLALSALVAGAFAGAVDNADVLTSLPNFNGSVPFNQYAGHLELKTEEKLFYWYTESQNQPDTDPIVLWLNGGPGCSSLGGFFTENGPFVVRPDLSVKLNRYSWNRKVNLVWLEQPAGVGFSGPLQNETYYNDDNVAEKAYEFVQLFFQKYPELQNREFYITGESYAGIYVPFLVNLLVNKPIEGVNLAGYAIGNPFTDAKIDGNAYVDYYYSHALLSLDNYDDLRKYCGDNVGKCMEDTEDCPKKCVKALEEGISSIREDDFNPYFIYGDKCLLSNSQGSVLRHVDLVDKSSTRRGDIGPCAETFTQSYLRIPEVQKALHVNDFVNWTDCNDEVGNRYTRADTALDKYRNILKHDLKGLIYSGDADSVVNFIGTQRWIGKDGLKLHITNKWRAWYGPDKQLAGYVEDYEGLTFLTVKGAGHMVPAVRPLHGLNMFECFIFGDEKCASFEYPIDEEEYEAGNEDVLVLSQTVPSKFVAEPSNGPDAGSFLVLAAVGSAIAALVAVAYKNVQKRSNYQPIGSGL
ncbi:hypothetical protein Poli38472_003764 [Pythium oligandrum]|uniref:Carboxypeptidase n=1 Tax=Pythium oligandrum TaxID=41045 RepID=A0A8K1FM75_PYTOL|nr:hypothetical protein Poli38472_003764 [Pythium oligandrum]|eukprot:TMW65999.1 hypothetical protein Poli38472_003764 [Pythium oligandrum]